MSRESPSKEINNRQVPFNNNNNNNNNINSIQKLCNGLYNLQEHFYKVFNKVDNVDVADLYLCLIVFNIYS